MTIHVFIGVGPANLHRALKIQKINPDSKLVFIDNRIRLATRDIDREKARANIFRFENEDVTEKLLAAGINEEELKPLIHQREFSVNQGFQSGDDRVFAAKPFTQIQIRDLQLLFMKTMDNIGGLNLPILIPKKVNLDSPSLINEIAGLLYEQGGIAPEEMKDIKIHVATGALTGKKEKNEIIYPDKAFYQMYNATDDLESMSVVPLHGTTTFIITNKISLEQLKNDQRSLDLTPWEASLSEFGWNLIRPPRVRVFYANDVLYIGAEIPVQMNNIQEKTLFEEQITKYTRAIASLVFPNLDIEGLPVNPFLRSRFPTERGETGDVLKNTRNHEFIWGVETIQSNVTVLTHGDSRYLPHYQTGSGFVTAFLQNELYAEIYGRKTFAELVEWAESEGKLVRATDVNQLEKIYLNQTGQNAQLALEAFQQELFMAFSRDIIEKNKERVGRYFNAIHAQTLDAMGKKLDHLLHLYNHYQNTALNRAQFTGINPSLVAMELMRTDNINFLREILPILLNMDCSQLSNKELLHVRDMNLLDFDKNLTMTEKLLKESKTAITQVIKKEKLTQAVDQVQTLLNDFNIIHKTNYKKSDFNETAKEILIMEMLNRNGDNIHFLRKHSLSLLDKNVSNLNDNEVFQCRNKFTENYCKLIDCNAIIRDYSMNNNLNGLIKNLAEAQGKQFNKVASTLKLPIIANESDAEDLRKNLLQGAVNHIEENPFCDELKLLLTQNSSNLAANLKTISASLKENKVLHQRAFCSFFRSKHSHTINAFAEDINTTVTKYRHDQAQLKIEVLSIMMKFHNSLEQGHSRRTMLALRSELHNILITIPFEPAM